MPRTISRECCPEGDQSWYLAVSYQKTSTSTRLSCEGSEHPAFVIIINNNYDYYYDCQQWFDSDSDSGTNRDLWSALYSVLRNRIPPRTSMNPQVEIRHRWREPPGEVRQAKDQAKGQAKWRFSSVMSQDHMNPAYYFQMRLRTP